eukprot:6126436-Amphidinium_carterae.2
MELLITKVELDVRTVQLLGYAWFLIHSRSRYRDALHSSREPELDVDLDGCGYVKTSTKVAKTIKSRVFRNTEIVL